MSDKIHIPYKLTRDGVEGGKVSYISDKVIMPKELTAENGAKSAMIGEYKVSTEMPTEDGEDFVLCDYDIPWTTIKQIYKDAVKLLGEPYGEN